MADDATGTATGEGPAAGPEVPDQTNPGGVSDPVPDLPEGGVDVSDIEEG